MKFNLRELQVLVVGSTLPHARQLCCWLQKGSISSCTLAESLPQGLQLPWVSPGAVFDAIVVGVEFSYPDLAAFVREVHSWPVYKQVPIIAVTDNTAMLAHPDIPALMKNHQLAGLLPAPAEPEAEVTLTRHLADLLTENCLRPLNKKAPL